MKSQVLALSAALLVLVTGTSAEAQSDKDRVFSDVDAARSQVLLDQLVVVVFDLLALEFHSGREQRVFYRPFVSPVGLSGAAGLPDRAPRGRGGQ